MTDTCSPILNLMRAVYSQEELNSILQAINRRFIELDYNCEQVFTNSDRFNGGGYIHVNKLYEILSNINVAINTDDFGILVHKYGVSGCLINAKKLIDDLNEVKPIVISELQRLKHQCTKSYPGWQCTDATKSLFKNLKDPILDYLPTDADNKTYDENYYWNVDDRLTRWTKYEPKDDLSTVMSRIQKQVNMYNLSQGLEDYFRGFDKLNSGKITIDNFLRGLDGMGISENITVSTGLILRRDEIKALVSYLADVEKPDHVAWRKFVDIIQQGAASQINKTKDLKNRLFRRITPDQVKSLQFNMAILRDAVRQKRLNFLPFFEQFDKTRTGYVTKSQFLRVMDQGNLPLGYQTGELASKYYSDVKGFDYTRFLPDLGLNEELRAHRTSFKDDLEEDRIFESVEKGGKEPVEFTNTECQKDMLKKALDKIYNEINIKGLQLSYFLKPLDKHNDGIIERATFNRVLRSAGEFHLTQNELDALMDEFSTNTSKNYTDIRKFLKAVGELNGNQQREHLKLENVYDKSSTVDDLRSLEEIFNKIIKRLRGIHDWEIVKAGTTSKSGLTNTNLVTRDSYYKILESLHILELLTEYEKELLFKVFLVQKGLEQRFDVGKFLKHADLKYRMMKQRHS